MSRTTRFRTHALAATAAALATLAAPGAHAQASSVTLYGLIDTTISTVNNTNAAGARTTGFQIPWFSGSRWGLTGKEDLGGGTSAIFKLESEYETPTGNMDTPGGYPAPFLVSAAQGLPVTGTCRATGHFTAGRSCSAICRCSRSAGRLCAKNALMSGSLASFEALSNNETASLCACVPTSSA